MEILGIGVDTEPVAGFRDKAYEWNKSFYGRIFSDQEIAYCLKKEDYYASFTGKFCAKEAVIKAFHHNNVFDAASVEIINNERGEPEAFVRGEKLNCFLSVSHSDDHAIAFCVAYA